MTKDEIRKRLKAFKYVQNKNGNIARLVEEVEGGCYCKPVNGVATVFWKNYKHVDMELT